jgi:hypothetical protein
LLLKAEREILEHRGREEKAPEDSKTKDLVTAVSGKSVEMSVEKWIAGGKFPRPLRCMMFFQPAHI